MIKTTDEEEEEREREGEKSSLKKKNNAKGLFLSEEIFFLCHVLFNIKLNQ